MSFLLLLGVGIHVGMVAEKMSGFWKVCSKRLSFPVVPPSRPLTPLLTVAPRVSEQPSRAAKLLYYCLSIFLWLTLGF